MVESKIKPNINFIKLSNEELSSKIALLVSKRTRVIFWKSAPSYQEGLAYKFQNNDQVTLILSDVKSIKKYSNEKICLNFIIDEVDYFFSGKVLEHDDENLMLFVELHDECFRLEKRSRERLPTYPKYEVFAYLKYLVDSPKNVIHFNKTEQKSKDFLSKLNDERLKKIIDLSDDLEINDEEDLVGFRVEDISSTGLSFFATQVEKEKILDKIGSAAFNLTINFVMQPFTFKDAKIVYAIDYINPDFKGVIMYKVGITFPHSPSLKRVIEDVSGINLTINDFRTEFEEFIRND
jgi:hypothetical protein